MPQANNINAQTTSNQERRDPHLRNGEKSKDIRFHPFQDESFIKNNEIIVSEGKTIIYLKSDYEINSYDIKYNMNKEVISSKKKTNVNGLNLFFSLLPGINLKIKEIELFSDEKKFLIPFDKLFVTSKNGYFDSNNNSHISIIFPKLSLVFLTSNSSSLSSLIFAAMAKATSLPIIFSGCSSFSFVRKRPKSSNISKA